MVYYKDKWGGILGSRDIKRKGKEGRESEAERKFVLGGRG